MNYKKVLATGAMVGMGLMSAVSAYAKEGVPVPSAADRAIISIKGVEAGATVKAYQVVEGVYNSEGIIRYQQTADSKAKQEIKDIENVTEYDVTNLAKWLYTADESQFVDTDVINLEYDAATKTYKTDKAEAGSYVVIVRTSDKTYIYNPMYVSNAYSDANDAGSLGKFVGVHGEANGTVDAEGDNTLEVGEGQAANATAVISRGGVAYAKKSHTQLDKDIVGASTGLTEVEDVQVGDTVSFEITTKTPDYSEGFKETHFRIQDVQMRGLDTVDTSTVKVFAVSKDAEGKTVETQLDGQKFGENDICKIEAFSDSGVVTENGENSFIVDFDSDWLKANPLTNIAIRYSTTVNDTAEIIDAATVNKANLDYWTLPTGEWGHLEDTVQLYTFEANAFKIAEDGDVIVGQDKEVEVINPLAGATFELKGVTTPVRKADGTVENIDISDRVYEMTTAEDGRIYFGGLDAGVYRMRETEAPEGMFLTDNVYTITITPTYGVEGEEGAELITGCDILIERTDKDGVLVPEEDGTQVSVKSSYKFDVEKMNAAIEAQNANKLAEYTAKQYDKAPFDADDYLDFFSHFAAEDNNENYGYDGMKNVLFTDFVIEDADTTVNTLGIVNQHLSKLPSTGGAGALIFSIAGVGLAALGSATLLTGKKKREEEA